MRWLQKLTHREPPPETACSRCGVPAPAGSLECSACGWDLREVYHEPHAESATSTGQADR
jgi:hypothetical protein